MEIKEAKEIIRAGAAWANWTEEQKEAMKVAYKSMSDVEEIKDICNRYNEKGWALNPDKIIKIIDKA